jgi:hypothetical protein
MPLIFAYGAPASSFLTTESDYRPSFPGFHFARFPAMTRWRECAPTLKHHDDDVTYEKGRHLCGHVIYVAMTSMAKADIYA